MIKELLGKIEFQESIVLNQQSRKKEESEELKHLDLFTAESPTPLAKNIGGHLGNFSRKFYPLPCYLSAVDDWIDAYSDIIATDKKFKKFTAYPDKDFKRYLLHKAIICKIARDEVLTKNPQILEAVNAIKIEIIGYPLVARAKKYLGLEINPYKLSSQEFNAIYAEIKQLKEGTN